MGILGFKNIINKLGFFHTTEDALNKFEKVVVNVDAPIILHSGLHNIEKEDELADILEHVCDHFDNKISTIKENFKHYKNVEFNIIFDGVRPPTKRSRTARFPNITTAVKANIKTQFVDATGEGEHACVYQFGVEKHDPNTAIVVYTIDSDVYHLVAGKPNLFIYDKNILLQQSDRACHPIIIKTIAFCLGSDFTNSVYTQTMVNSLLDKLPRTSAIVGQLMVYLPIEKIVAWIFGELIILSYNKNVILGRGKKDIASPTHFIDSLVECVIYSNGGPQPKREISRLSILDYFGIEEFCEIKKYGSLMNI